MIDDKLVALTKGFFAIVDASDFDSLSKYSWSVTSDGRGNHYAQRWDKRGLVRMHRQILGLRKGNHRVCDHVNGNTLDNRRSNLRITKRQLNMCNQKLRSDNSLGFKGVCQKRGRYRAQIQIEGRKIHLGTFDYPEAAYAAYCAAADKYHGAFANHG